MPMTDPSESPDLDQTSDEIGPDPWQARLDRLKTAALAMRQTLEEQTDSLGKKEEEIALLTARVAERDQSLRELEGRYQGLVASQADSPGAESPAPTPRSRPPLAATLGGAVAIALVAGWVGWGLGTGSDENPPLPSLPPEPAAAAIAVADAAGDLRPEAAEPEDPDEAESAAEEVKAADAPAEETDPGDGAEAAEAPETDEGNPTGGSPVKAADRTRELTAAQESQRKAVRSEMVRWGKKEKWSEVVRLGETLRQKYRIDWEAELLLAEGLRRTKHEAAAAAYRAFATAYPTSPAVAEAYYYAGSLDYKAGRQEEARAALKRAAKKKGSKYARKAKQLLAAVK